MRLTLRKKLLLIFTSTALTSIVLTCLILGLQIRASSIAAFHHSTARELVQIDRVISVFMDKALKMTTLIAELPLVRAADSSLNTYMNAQQEIAAKDVVRTEAELRLYELFVSIHKQFPEYVEAFMGTKWGGYVSSVDEMPTNYDPRKRPWYLRAMEVPDKASLAPAYLSAQGEAGIGAMHPIVSSDGSIIGSSGLGVSLTVLTDLVQKSPIGKSGYLILVQNDGTILAHARSADLNFKKLKESQVPALVQLDAIDEGGMEVEMDGRAWLAQVHTIGGLGWKLIGVIEKSEVLADFQAMLWKMLVVAAVLVSIFFVLAFFLASAIAKPVVRATAMLKEVATGDLTCHMEVSTSDELGDMAQSFNAFLEQWRGSIKELLDNGHTLGSEVGRQIRTPC